jgi:hypothetical protein
MEHSSVVDFESVGDQSWPGVVRQPTSTQAQLARDAPANQSNYTIGTLPNSIDTGKKDVVTVKSVTDQSWADRVFDTRFIETKLT